MDDNNSQEVMKKLEKVNHPNHYKGNTSLECIDCMKLVLGHKGTLDFCLGNAFKYMWRYKNKNGAEDLEKAEWYLDYAEHMFDVGEVDVAENVYNGCDDIMHRLRDLLSDLS